MTTTEKKSNSTYWLIVLVSLVACIAFLIFLPEWFWVTLPFICTYLVLAFDAM
ncbi:MAG: hypothetical protein KA974_06185 [Saprospiraceae bacterium]|nr:hypothetical protein [Saprospiraceae bacterium]MBP7680231.1 hypothetical protein [Saprospiraceae bacterium]